VARRSCPAAAGAASARSSLTTARDAFADWLSRLDATADDWEALHLAMVEMVTNAIEHAYPRGRGSSSSTRAWAATAA
jgi:anti-sigma regulatory factor (Ser/Thr protein kinase)